MAFFSLSSGEDFQVGGGGEEERWRGGREKGNEDIVQSNRH